MIEHISSGQERNIQDIPIEIHSNKLLEWLVDRKRVSPHWNTEYRKLDEKIKAALETVPRSEEVTNFISTHSSDFQYLECVTLLNLLEKKSNIDIDTTKNLFGNYHSPVLSEWQAIIKAFEKNYLFLAKAGHTINQIQTYEIPLIRRGIEKFRKQIEICARRENEAHRNRNQSANELASIRKEWQIGESSTSPQHIREDVQAVGLQVEDILGKVREMLHSPLIPKAIHYYKVVSSVLHETSDDTEFLPMLHYFLKYGDTSMKTWETMKAGGEITPATDMEEGEPKANREKLTHNENSEQHYNLEDIEPIEEQEQEQEINWDVETYQGGEQEIHWDVQNELETSQEIDWDIGEENTQIIQDIDLNSVIECEQSGLGIVAEDLGIQNKNVSISKPSQRLLTTRDDSILISPTTRYLLVNDILELHSFLRQRNNETTSSSSFETAIISIGELGTLRQLDTSFVEEAANLFQQILSVLDGHHTRQLLEIKFSTRFVERIVEQILHKTECVDKLQTLEIDMQHKRPELEGSIQLAYSKIDAFKTRIKQLAHATEKALSRIYNNRKVIITITEL